MEYTLTMTFITETGEKANITISDVRDGITDTEVKTLMDSLIENNIFDNKKGLLESKYSAQIVKREVTKFDLDSLV